ncbi:carbohydrate ABC transporter permease [Amycolatopsis suaedae]|uniref:Carbohydrate ABC transporter permease n=1 Tax=Amycolatopsis suaedae TaxID=2510978 RepID=A0A4V2EL48_9PSEU|nr:carbohydrate ABC transporter permease [Amycolatopsis suaedae]RZQ60315.1 carbohydrate ABC transporter permease [Amycolatopsis suaedae]
MFPLYWSVVVASRDESVVGDRVPELVPGGHLLDNIGRVFDTVDFWLAMQNSLIVATTVTVANALLSSLAGFAFARLRFPGRDSLFLLVIGTAMVPAQLGLVPLYLVVGELGWYGRLEAVIVPALVSAFSVFWMRQACEEAVPAELVDAATVDGCSRWRIYWNVALPQLRPHLAALSTLTFAAAWNDFFWPLVVLDPHEYPTVQVALARLASGYFTDHSLMLAAATLAILPVLVLFLLLSRYVVTGLTKGTLDDARHAPVSQGLPLGRRDRLVPGRGRRHRRRQG